MGNIGTLAAKVEQRGSISSIDLYSVGLHWRTRLDDLGAHLGFSRRTYAFTADGTVQPGWYFIRVPSPDRDSVAQDLWTLGIELSATAPLEGVALGYSHSRLFARLSADESWYLGYAGANANLLGLQQCREAEPCEITVPSH